MASKNTAASLNPEGFVEGGGLVDDVDVTLKENRFDVFDYNGTVKPGVPSLKIVMDLEDGEEATQYYSMGSPTDWAPSEDGTQLVAIGKATNIRLSSNGGIFLKALVDAGFPADKLGDDISILDGLQAHMIQVPAPKRPGIKKKAREDGREFADTILIVSEIKTLPWEKSKPRGAPAGSKKTTTGKGGTTKKKSAPASDDDAKRKTTLAILAILEEEGSIAKKDLPTAIFRNYKSDPDRNAMVKTAFDDEFLGGGPWTYEDNTLVAA